MDKTKIFKGLALFNFIALLTLFLFFRNDSFDKYFNSDKNLTSPNGGTPTKLSKDTITQKKDSLQRQRLSSSKSLVIIDNLKLDKDTTKITKDSITINLTEEEKRLMYSSKSGIIIDPKLFKPDSLKLKPKNSKKKKN
jgi:hypothetical protein